MRIGQATAFLILQLFVFSAFCLLKSDTITSSVTEVKEGPDAVGTWRTKVHWRYYWVKDWQLKQMYVPIWKKVWTPIEVREWFPLPNPPPPPPLPPPSGVKKQRL